MSLPGLPFQQSDCSDSQRRASAGSVAKYYENYVEKMALTKYFANNFVVLNVEQIKDDTKKCINEMKPIEVSRKKCSIINALNYLRSRTKCHKKVKETCVFRNCKKFKEKKCDLNPIDHNETIHNLKNDEKSYLLNNKYPKHVQNSDFSEIVDPFSSINCDSENFYSNTPVAPCDIKTNNLPLTKSDSNEIKNKWLIHTYNQVTSEFITFCSNYLVLANGASDLPNRLGLSAESYNFSWVLHDLRSLETQLDSLMEINCRKDPVLVIGAGLSAADAVIATRFRSIPVLHVFRNKSVSLDKQLPENMYPEYHKVNFTSKYSFSPFNTRTQITFSKIFFNRKSYGVKRKPGCI